MTKTWLALVVTLLGFPASALAAARVSSDSDCPSSEAVSLRLLVLLAAGGPEQANARVHLDGSMMQLELSTVGEEIRQRTVPATGDCNSRAETAALIIAAWLDAMPVGTLRAPGIPPREPQGPREEASDREVPKHPEDESLDDSGTRTLSIGTRTLIGAGLFGLADSQGASTGISVEAAMPNLLERFGWIFRASLGLPRQRTVGDGTARYWRPTFVWAASLDFHDKKWALRVQAGAALAALLVNGTGYQENRSDNTVMWGFDAGLVGARRWNRSEGWLRLGAVAWPQGRSIRTTTSVGESTAALPGWEVGATLGFSWAIL